MTKCAFVLNNIKTFYKIKCNLLLNKADIFYFYIFNLRDISFFLQVQYNHII